MAPNFSLISVAIIKHSEQKQLRREGSDPKAGLLASPCSITFDQGNIAGVMEDTAC